MKRGGDKKDYGLFVKAGKLMRQVEEDDRFYGSEDDGEDDSHTSSSDLEGNDGGREIEDFKGHEVDSEEGDSWEDDGSFVTASESEVPLDSDEEDGDNDGADSDEWEDNESGEWESDEMQEGAADGALAEAQALDLDTRGETLDTGKMTGWDIKISQKAMGVYA
jgi:hypothetical protein